MALPYVDGDFTVASAQGKPRRTYPFRGDTASFYVEQDFIQYFANFAALAISTAHPDVANCYLVSEGPQGDLGGGIARWTRTYAKIPVARVWYETYPHKIPGINEPSTVLCAPVTSANIGTPTTIGHGGVGDSLIVGDSVTIWFPLIIAGAFSIEYFRRAVRAVNVGAHTFDVDFVPGLAAAVTAGSECNFMQVGQFRQPFTKVVLSSIHYDYYLPGVTGGITTVADIPILNPTPIKDYIGQEVDAYGTYTNPTLATYRASVIAADSVVVEASALHPWMGNIWERVTRYITQI